MSVAPRLLEQVKPLLHGRVVSGDARYCQKSLCLQVRAAGADSLFGVKANQPSLHEAIALLFRDPPPGEVFLTAQTVDKHGGRLERRQVRASATLAGYLQEAAWPEVGLVLEVEAWVSWPGHPMRPVRHEIRYFLSSLPAATPPTEVLRRVRQQWYIENRLHWPRDVTWAKTPARCAPAPRPRPWPPSATPSWGCSGATPSPTAPRPSAPAPGRPRCTSSACLVSPAHKL